jgi:hypothetical protein
MKKLTVLLLAFFLLPGFIVWAEMRGGAPESRPVVVGRPAPSAFRQPVVINMSRGSSGGHNRNFPSQQNNYQTANRPVVRQPSYGQLHWNNATAVPPQPSTQTQINAKEGQVSASLTKRPSIQSYSQAGVKAAVSVHHHAYTQGYVRKKLQKIGVTAEPNLITDRSEIMDTDKTHSTIPFPRRDSVQRPITAAAVSPRHFNDGVVRNQMMVVDSPEWQARADQFNASENQAGRYYWHNDGGINYCHYLDASGYHWYGWYVGDEYFWTRNFSGRWWWYDPDFNRWCFWNNGFWWWQDSYHVGDLYCYNDDAYVPCNSAEDQVVVTAPTDSVMRDIPSPDGTRNIKIDQATQDAFLYDTANPPSFDPVYLASGVESAQFSDPSNGRPMEIILKLNDGSFDLFDSVGNPYNPGLLDEDEARQGDAPAP